MDKVAKHCGVSKKTIYGLFGNKDELVETLTLAFLKEERMKFSIEVGQVQVLGKRLLLYWDIF